ncbi:MAG: protoporphyrinogen oxidase [Trueperaceae bacterium]|nr:protoporphyrinogen oxidase [Trueperaceae bacterium]
MTAPYRVRVVGAGLAGLAAAHAVRRHAEAAGVPLDLAVLEASDQPGGQLRTVEADGVRFDWAANAFRTGAGPTADLLARLGLENERIEASKAAAKRFILHGGRLHELPSGPGTLLSFTPMSLAGRLRIALEPFVARRVPDEESVFAYAARHIGPEAADVLLGTMVRGVYGGDVRRLSVDAAFPVMKTMERDHRSLVVAAIAGAKERKRVGKTTWTLRGGMQRLPYALADDLNAGREDGAPVVRLNAPVSALARRADGGYVLTTPHGRDEDADAVVLAVGPQVARTLVADAAPDLAASLDAIPTGHLAVATFVFDDAAFDRTPEGYGFLVAPSEPVDVLGALFESNLFEGRAPDGTTVIRVIMGGAGREDVLAKDDAALRATALGVLDQALGVRDAPRRAWTWRQPYAIPQYELGHHDRVAAIEGHLAALPGVQVAGNAYRGVAVGALVEDAELVAERTLAHATARGAAGPAPAAGAAAGVAA